MEAPVEARPSLSIVRQIRATPETVFAHWTDPRLVARWFCPPGVDVRSVEVEPRLGGRFHVVMQEGEDGEIHDVSGIYREFDPPRKLVFSWAWITMPERESLVTVELGAIDGGTELTLTHSRFADERARDSHHEGWSGSLDKLVRLLEGEG